MSILSDKKGVIMLAIPLTLALIGLLGTGVFAEMDHEKNLAGKRDIKRQSDVSAIQDKLTDFYYQHQAYPIQKDQSKSGQEALTEALGEIPSAPSGSYWYWSDGQFYSLRYLSETTKSEVMVFSQ